MTQNKKFKKLVRARMAETGETYMQARRALGGDDRPSVPTLRALGFWKHYWDQKWPDPVDLVDASWDPEERRRVIEHLNSGAVVRAGKEGLNAGWCRLGCSADPLLLGSRKSFFAGAGTSDASLTWEERRTARRRASERSQEANLSSRQNLDMGNHERTDGVYVWPEGLPHYLEKHNVRLPREFVDHVLKQPELRGRQNAAAMFDVDAGFKDRRAPKSYDVDEGWWLRATNLKGVPTTPDDLRRTLRTMWHQVYSSQKGSFGFHIYADAPEDGRVHISLCGGAETRTWETKTPGGPHCEKCKLLKVRTIFERQKKIGDPLNILHDAELWAATGGTEEERIATRDDLWGEPPGRPDMWGSKPVMPQFVEIESPFNPGWYFHDSEYPEEGSIGPYNIREDAVQAARLAEYDVDDPDAVTFWEQEKPAAVLQRFAMEHLRDDLLTTLHEFAGKDNTLKMQERIQELLAERLRAAVKKLEAQGVTTPPEEDFGMEVTAQTGVDQGVLTGRVWLRHPQRYPQLVRDLADAGIIEPRYLVSAKFKEAE